MKTYQIIENNITYDIEEDDNGDKFWYLNDKLHRENGPALEFADGTKEWYKSGKCHRDNGHAVECSDRSKQYWYNDAYLEHIHSDEDLKRYIKLLSIS